MVEVRDGVKMVECKSECWLVEGVRGNEGKKGEEGNKGTGVGRITVEMRTGVGYDITSNMGGSVGKGAGKPRVV